MKYEHKKIERKWQDFWEKNKIFKSVPDKTREKIYVLDNSLTK